MGKKENIISKKIDEIFENRNVAIGVACVCAILIILTVIFFAVDVFDAINMRSSINVRSKNAVTYVVNITDEAKALGQYPNDILDMNQSYLLDHTKSISVLNSAEAQLSKGVNSLAYKYTATTTLVVRSQTSGNSVVLSRTTEIPTSSSLVTSQASDRINVNLMEAHTIYLGSYINDFQDFERATPGVRLTGELVVEFKLSIRDGKNIDTSIQRGLVIPFTSKTYKISFTGQDVRDQNFPERNIQLPSFPVLVLITILLVAFIWLLNISLKKAFLEKDEYKRTLKDIFKKSIDGIVMTNTKATVPNYPAIDVKDFKELAKTSLSLNKPIVCFEATDGAIFYVICDNLLYRFILINKSATKTAAVAEKSAEKTKA